jgi:hypothetical protein
VPEDIVCAAEGCGERPSSPRAVEVGKDGKWYCMKHANLGTKFGVPTIAFVRDRLTQTLSTNEPRVNFVVRELVQNADDAKASMLVLRFEDDALYVANDGETFTRIREENKPSDFDNITDILNRAKQDDKEKTGNFGSGFQTVFALTNLPEIHSDDTMCTLDAVKEVPVWGDKPRFSPYIGGPPGLKGVLFRFPWRDDEAAEEVFEGKSPFSQENDWPRWRKGELKDRYAELKRYCRDVLLCCQHLKTIRLVWALGTRPTSFQVSRDFALNESGDNIEVKTVVGSEVSEGPEWFSWDKGKKEPARRPPCFDETKKLKVETVWSYLVASAAVRDENGGEIRIGKDESDAVSIGTGPQGTRDIKKNHVHLLFPLDPPTDPGAVSLLYSVIPLPMSGSNRFVFTAHFFPMSSRKDVDTSGNAGKNREWYHACMRSIAHLYREAFPALLQAVANSPRSLKEKNQVLLSNLPRTLLNDWMRPEVEKGAEAEWARADSEKLFTWLEEQQWIATEKGAWWKPADAHLAPGATEKEVSESLKLVVYPEELLDYAEKASWLRALCEKRKFGPDTFKLRWGQIKDHNVRWKGLRYGQACDLPWDPEGIKLTAKTLTPIIKYALANETTRSEDVVPSEEGALKAIASFKRLPEDLRFVEELFPPDWRIHHELDAVVSTVEKSTSIRMRETKAASEVPSLIADAVKDQQAKFDSLNPSDHQILSRALVVMTTNEKLKFDRKQSLRMRYLPYRRDGRLLIGELPPVDERRSSLGESYERDWIFARKRRNLEGLPPEIEAKIRFFELSPEVPIDTVEKVEGTLLLVPLEANPGKATDYARHFLSGKHGSLFVDEELTKFIGDVNQEMREQVKRAMLKAVRQYWKDEHDEADLTPTKMGEVPCVYDAEGNWGNANEFALVGGDFAKVVGYRSLDPYFDDWGKARVAIGVKPEIGPAEVKDKVLKLLKSPLPNRRDLATIFDAVVIQYPEEKLRTLSKELRASAWVPVAGGGLSEPQRALFPTKRNLSILGKGFGLFVSTGMVRPENSEGPPSSFEESKLKALDVRVEPDVDDLLAALSTCARSGIPPPTGLLQELSDRKIDALDKMKMPYYGFWWEGRWRSGRMRVLKEADRALISGSLGQILVLSEEEASPYEHYLKWIGAQWQLLPEDLLEELKLMSSKPNQWSDDIQARYRKIWQRLEIEAESIPPAVVASFRAETVVRGTNVWYPPMNVLIVDSSISASSVAFFKTLIITPAESGEALSRLGAIGLEALTKEDAIRLAWDCAGEGPSPAQVDAYLSLIERGVSKKWWEQGRPLPLPAVRRGRLEWARKPRDAALGNAVVAAIMSEIPLVITQVKGSQSITVVKQALAWGYGQLSASVVYPDLSPEESEEHALERAIKSACRLLARYYDPDPSHFEWVDKLEVKSVRGARQRYESPWGSGSFAIPALVPLNPEQTALLIPKDQQTIDEQTAALITDWAVAEGFPNEKREAFVRNMVSAIPRIEDQLNEQEEENSPAYNEMVEQLKPMYGSCQICRMTTPYKVSEDGSLLANTQESVKSVVGAKSVMYLSDDAADFVIGNCLYLCPRHAKLASRQLVLFPFLDDFESRRDEVLSDLAARAVDVTSKIGPDGYYHLEIKVYEGKSGGPVEWSYTEILWLKPDHAVKLYEHLSSFVKNS